MRYSQKQRALCKTERQKFEHGVNQDKEKRVFCLDENVKIFTINIQNLLEEIIAIVSKILTILLIGIIFLQDE